MSIKPRVKYYAPTKASPSAEARADMNRNIAITRDLIFLGALVKAYSRPVMEAKISLKAIKT
jgi:hypothetical protein